MRINWRKAQWESGVWLIACSGDRYKNHPLYLTRVAGVVAIAHYKDMDQFLKLYRNDSRWLS